MPFREKKRSEFGVLFLGFNHPHMKAASHSYLITRLGASQEREI